MKCKQKQWNRPDSGIGLWNPPFNRVSGGKRDLSPHRSHTTLDRRLKMKRMTMLVAGAAIATAMSFALTAPAEAKITELTGWVAVAVKCGAGTDVKRPGAFAN
jgi:hypothetical protein